MIYEQLLGQLNHAMLAGDRDRVALLSQVRSAMGKPDEAYHKIHVAGTNGKGSSGALLVNVLRHAGYHVGYFSSPALVDEREMIQVDGHLIARDDFVKTYKKIASQLPAGIKESALSVFEWWTLIALQYFADSQVDWAVIECGLGGQNDATNVIGHPDLAIITHLALDHTDVLGPHISDIAGAAAGIIKPKTALCVIAPQQDYIAQRTIEDRCRACAVPVVNSQVTVAIDSAGPITEQGRPCQLSGAGFNDLKLTCQMSADYQLANLQTVAAASAELVLHHVVTVDDLSWAAAHTSLPARFQRISDSPRTYLDAAHNPDGARQLIATCNHLFGPHQVIFLLGFLADKDWRQMADLYQAAAKDIVIAKPSNQKRSLAPATLAQVLPHATVAVSPPAGLKRAQQIAGNGGVVVATGSFYLVKDLLPQVLGGQQTSHLDPDSAY